MFCTHCGKELTEGYKFCDRCGAPVSAPVAEEVTAPAVEAVAAPVVEEVAAPAVEAVEAPAVEETVAPVVAAPVAEAPAAPVKKKKKGLIIALCIAIPMFLLCSLGAVAGILWYNWDTTYNEAMTLLDAGQHEEALEKLQKISMYKDAAEVAQELEAKLDAYYEAVEILEEKHFDEATQAFKRLGSFKDSKEYIKNIIPYERALYIMECAEKDGEAGLTAAPELAEITTEDPGMVPVIMYEIAGNRFADLGDYADSREMKNACYTRAGMLCLEMGYYEGVEKYIALMDMVARGELLEAYMGDCDDGNFLSCLREALVTRAFMAEDENASYSDLVALEREILDQLTDPHFYDTRLEELYYAYMAGLDNQEYAIGKQDHVIWYTGAAMRFEAVEALYNEYGFLEDDPEMVEIYVGNSRLYWAYAALEEALNKQLLAVAPEYDTASGRYYLNFVNETDYSFALDIVVECYNGNVAVWGSESMTFEIPQGEVVQVWLQFPDAEVSWDSWYLYWNYYNIMLADELL